MKIATYVDGRPIEYDEATGGFSIQGAPVSADFVAGYDRAGQATWESPQMRDWFFQVTQGSQQAVQAPLQPKKKRTGLVLGLVLGAFALCAVCGVVGSLMPKSSEPDSQPAPAKPAAAPAPAPTKPAAAVPKPAPDAATTSSDVTGIGQPLKVGDLVFTVHDVKSTKQLKSPLGNKTGNWVIVTVSVKNMSKDPVTINTSFFKLLQPDGTTYETDGDNLMYVDSDSTFFLEQINPKLEKTGKALFEVPAGTSPGKLQVQTGFWGTQTGEISLAK